MVDGEDRNESDADKQENETAKRSRHHTHAITQHWQITKRLRSLYRQPNFTIYKICLICGHNWSFLSWHCFSFGRCADSRCVDCKNGSVVTPQEIKIDIEMNDEMYGIRSLSSIHFHLLDTFSAGVNFTCCSSLLLVPIGFVSSPAKRVRSHSFALQFLAAIRISTKKLKFICNETNSTFSKVQHSLCNFFRPNVRAEVSVYLCAVLLCAVGRNEKIMNLPPTNFRRIPWRHHRNDSVEVDQLDVRKLKSSMPCAAFILALHIRTARLFCSTAEIMEKYGIHFCLVVFLFSFSIWTKNRNFPK